MVEIERIDRYTIRVNGHRVRADEVTAKRIQHMTDEQVERFLTIMGARDGNE